MRQRDRVEGLSSAAPDAPLPRLHPCPHCRPELLAPAPLHRPPALVHSGCLGDGILSGTSCPSAPRHQPAGHVLLPPRRCPVPSPGLVSTRRGPQVSSLTQSGCDRSPHPCPLSQRTQAPRGSAGPEPTAGGELGLWTPSPVPVLPQQRVLKGICLGRTPSSKRILDDEGAQAAEGDGLEPWPPGLPCPPVWSSQRSPI
uniref:Uncharacterized protein n=1 Tax=Molossus molossus TaxID=27622 RepID=A0A7J8FS92_MOLMO|nr:hypothetical protein HJG59_008453 [Molossus molossus]